MSASQLSPDGRYLIALLAVRTGLKSHVTKALDAIRTHQMLANPMEDWAARCQTPLETCMDQMEQNDGAVVLLSMREGELVPGLPYSYTHLETEAAIRLHKPILGFEVDMVKANVHPIDVDLGDAAVRLQRTKDLVARFAVVERFKSPNDLNGKLLSSLEHLKDQVKVFREEKDLARSILHAAETDEIYMPLGRQVRSLRATVEIIEEFQRVDDAFADLIDIPKGLSRTFASINGDGRLWLYCEPDKAATMLAALPNLFRIEYTPVLKSYEDDGQEFDHRGLRVLRVLNPVNSAA